MSGSNELVERHQCAPSIVAKLDEHDTWSQDGAPTAADTAALVIALTQFSMPTLQAAAHAPRDCRIHHA